MMVLGLLPPYTADDVKQAYLDKVKVAHPDQGGAIAEFRRIQQAYEQAQEFVAIQSDRRSWIASQMDRYIAQQEVEQRLREMGAELEIRYTDWLQKLFGDFAELTASIEAIELVDAPLGNSVVDYIVDRKASLSRLKRLVLVGCGVTVDHALRLSSFPLLSHLDLSRNRLTNRVAQLAASLPNLQTLRVDGSSVGWWGRFQIARTLRKRQYQADPLQDLG
jgi:hypothetical protein